MKNTFTAEHEAMTAEIFKLAKENGLTDDQIMNNLDKCILAYIQVQDKLRDQAAKEILDSLV